MLVIAHRGANKEALENSWSAYEKAIEAGAKRIELDVQVTKDDELVIYHDEDLRHILRLNKLTTDLTRDEFRKLSLPNGEPLPFLDEVIQRLLPRIELNIEIKPREPRVAEKVMQLLSGKDLSKVIISSFEPDPLLYLSQHYPETQLACLWGDHFRLTQCFYASPLNLMQSCRSTILHPAIGHVTENLMDQARVRGWRVFPYAGMTEEDAGREEIWAFLQAMGVDGLCTNYPRELALWLAKEAA